MTFDEKIEQADKLIAKLKSNELYDDLRQEIAVEMWLNPDADVKAIVKYARIKVFGDEAKHQRARAPHLYNDDGECVDDDVYYVDQSTVEQGEVRESPVTDEMREKVAEIVKTKRYISALYCTNTYNKMKDINRIPKWMLQPKCCLYKTTFDHTRVMMEIFNYFFYGAKRYENKRNQRIALQAN